MTLACEDANSIHIEVVIVDAEKPVENSLMQIWKLKFCRRDETLFSQYFAADVWLGLWSWILVEILKLCLVKILKFKLWYELNPRVRCSTGAQCESDFVFLSVSLSLSLCLCLQLCLPSSWPNFHKCSLRVTRRIGRELLTQTTQSGDLTCFQINVLVSGLGNPGAIH